MLKFDLYPYQQKNIADIKTELTRHQHIINCAATGSGKTVVFMSISQSAIDKGTTVLIVTEALSIFRQISSRVPRSLMIADGCAKDTQISIGSINVAMAQTLSRRERIIEQLKALGKKLLIIVDEAHVGTPTKLLMKLREAYLIGFTATPYYPGAKHLPLLYDSIVVGAQPAELVAQGFLAPYRHFARTKADTTKLVKKGGEFTEKSQEEVFGSRVVFDGIVEDLGAFPYKKALVFTASINDCEQLYKELRQAGFVVSRSHSGLDEKTQARQMRRFTKGSTNICLSVGQLTKGFDYPPIDLILIRKATMSLSNYFQMIGRASRILIGGNKSGFTVLDYGENYKRFGLWDSFVDWKNLWNKPPKKKRETVAAIKVCGNCEYIVNSSARFCPNCNFEFPVQSSSLKKDSELIELTEELKKIAGRKLSELNPGELSIFARLKKKGNYAIRIAKSLNQKNDGYLKDFARAMGYKSGWVDYQLSTIKEGEEITFYDQIVK